MVLDAFSRPESGGEIQDRGIGGVHAETWADILNALEELHLLGYVHRDLKPSNILLHGRRWKLADLGLVQPVFGGTTRFTTPSTLWGTELYLAPEQLRNFQNTSDGADIYSFGCILYDAFVGGGRAPFQQYTHNSQIGWVIEKCTDLEPSRRFRNVGLLREALLRILTEFQDTPQADTSGWVDALSFVDGWDSEKVEKMVMHLKDPQTEGHGEIFRALGEEAWQGIHSLNPGAWQVLVKMYTTWVGERSYLDFSYCDVIARQLEKIAELGGVAEKASASVAAAKLGRSHNRWFVMRTLMRMCGPSMDDRAAERTAIEIFAEDAAADFAKSAERISRSIAEFHPQIHNAIMREQERLHRQQERPRDPSPPF